MNTRTIPPLDEVSTRTIQRVFAKVWQTAGCWGWQGNTTHDGYGKVAVGGGEVLVHRLMYRWLVGPIPEDLELGHLCANPGCVHPRHVQPMSHRDNMVMSQRNANARKAECPRGHPYDRTDRRGARRCRRCTAASGRAYRTRLRAAQLPRADPAPPSRPAPDPHGPQRPSTALLERPSSTAETRQRGSRP